MNEAIVLLHGIARTERSMAGIARFFTRQGYAAHNLGYPSRYQPIEQLAEGLHAQIAAIDCNRLHFIGYSMGGLLARAYITRYRPPNLGRLVLIGTPNGGSEIADFLQARRPYRAIYGPAGQQLITGFAQRDQLFGPLPCETGIIAGSRAIHPFALLIDGPSDGTVSIASTKLPDMTDHVIIPNVHTFLPISRKAWRHALHFLQHGCFA